MDLKKYLQHVLILAYLAVTAAALLYTLAGKFTPIPWGITRFFYGMMAPYQGYPKTSEALVAEGLTDAGWEIIPIEQYQPYMRGEKGFRINQMSFRALYDDDEVERQYGLFLAQLRIFESEEGRTYSKLRLWEERWPMSPEGFETLRQEPFLKRSLLAEIE